MRAEVFRDDLPCPLLVGNEWVTTRPGGLNRYLADLVAALGATGMMARTLVVGEGPPSRGIIGVGRQEQSVASRLLAIRRAACALAPSVDVIDAHFALYALPLIYTTCLRRLPLVVHFQGPWAEEGRTGRGEGRARSSAKWLLEWAVYQRAEAVVVLSEAFERVVIDRYRVPESKVVVVPPGVDLERFHPGDQKGARAALGIDSNAFVAMAVRRLDARMGLDVLLDAWGQVQNIRSDAMLLLAGDGRERDRLEAMRARLANPYGIKFLGRVTEDELVRLYQAANCSVVPSLALEGFGLVTLESLACGTPPIVTDVGGLPGGVVGLDTSLIVPAGEPKALADRLLAAAVGALPTRDACRRHAEGFSWDRVAERHIEIYERARGRRPPRVAYVGHSAALSGGELALSRALQAMDDVEPFVVLAEDGRLVDRLHAQGIAVETLAMPERARVLRRERVRLGSLPLSSVAASARYAWRLQRRLRVLGVDLVHTNTLKAALYGGIAGRLAGIPVVWHIRDRIAPDYLPGFAVRLVRLAARLLPSSVIANSAATLATLPRSGVVVPSPIYDSALLPPVRGMPDADGPFTVGIVGRLAPWKGQDLFLRAFAATFGESDARARIVGSAMFGEDDYAESLKKLSGDLGIGDRVEFVGFTEDVSHEYARLHVLVHASKIPEPFGQVVVEGMAAAVAVVASGEGGPAEIVTDGVDGLLYPPGDVETLSELMRRLADDPELRRRLGDAGRERAKDFAPEKIAEQLTEVYREVLIRRRKRRGRRRMRLLSRAEPLSSSRS